jgi:hypothetical protein
MVNTVVHVENIEENLTAIERFLKDSGCEKCLDIETHLHEALKELKFHTFNYRIAYKCI